MKCRLSYNFFTVYIKRGATKNTPRYRKPITRKAFRASFKLGAAEYIGPADAAPAGNFPLSLGQLIVQAVAQSDNHPLPRSQTGLDALTDLDAGVPSIQILQHVVVYRDHIHQRQGPSVPRRLQGVGEGYLTLELALRTKMHENLIFNAPAGIGGQPYIFIRLEGGDSLNQSNGPNGDQVVLISGLSVIFF